jgi:hypothetical protein
MRLIHTLDAKQCRERTRRLSEQTTHLPGGEMVYDEAQGHDAGVFSATSSFCETAV